MILRVCCAPLPILGFTVFRPFSRTPYDLLSIDLPRCSPFEAFSLSAAIHSLDSTSSPLPSEDGPISRFLSADQVRCVPPMFPPAEARCFLGFLPVAPHFLPAVEDLTITSGLATQGLVQHSSVPFLFNSPPVPRSSRRGATSKRVSKLLLVAREVRRRPNWFDQTGPLTASSRSSLTTSDRLRVPQDIPCPCGPEVQYPEVRNPTLESP